jgi:NAD(P)-dependent dehydrogenase (short-subunit alcohol dehydrogenase family)
MEYNPFSLSGKNVLITGASSGIGKAIAIECSKIGANVIISGRNTINLQQTFEQLEGDGHMQIIADLLEPSDITRLVEELPALDGVVHCAGFTKTLPFQFINEEDLSKIMQVNFTSPALISNYLIKSKKIIKGGSIVFISSISGVFCSYVAGSMYSASKGAINGIAKGMAIELGSKGIRVNTVCPGMVNTNILQAGVISEEQLRLDIQRYPLKRYGKPEEVAYAVIYLLSDASSWVTGSNLLIDGGYTLQ